jgi:hypothetical protein
MTDHILIPTLGRMDKQYTYNHLPQKWKDKVTFIVQNHEYAEMAERYGDKVRKLPDDIKTLSPTRQWCWDEYYGTQWMFMDDDFKYFKYKEPLPEGSENKWLTRDMEDHEFDDMFDTFWKWADEEIYFGAVSTSWVMPSATYWPYMNNTRMMTNMFFNTPYLPRDIQWNRLPTAQDFDATLQLLTRGYRNRMHTKYRVTVSDTNAKGGCETYRTLDMMNSTHRKLSQLFPKYVSIREKILKTGPLAGQTQDSCFIQWSKAFKDTQK